MSHFLVPPNALFLTRAPSHGRSGEVLTVVPFLGLAREISMLLTPVRPSSQFRADLERSLLAAARQLNAQQAITGFTPQTASAGSPFASVERRWVIGAAAAAVGSAVSIAGIVAYMLHRRSERAA